MRKASLTLLLTLLGAVPGSAESLDWVRRIPDVYDGEIFSGSDLLPGSTEFVLDGGALTGRYAFTEGGETVEGRLDTCAALPGQVLTCLWRDKYGSGRFTATFEPSLQSFTGHWVAPGAEAYRLPWTGKRRIGS